MKSIINILLSILSLLVACKSGKQEKLTIATAANMQWALNELIQEFSRESGINCEMIVSSSGKITAQINEGAPFDVFLSADMRYPETLFQSGLTTATPIIYAYGGLVLWTGTKEIKPSMDLLLDNKIVHIALANPDIAPYGKASVQVLNYYNIYEQVERKLVFGESISQTNQFIASGAAEIGFTAKSAVLSPSFLTKGSWAEIDPEAYTPIAQGAVIIKSSDQMESSEKFIEFLISDKSKEILNKFGYTQN